MIKRDLARLPDDRRGAPRRNRESESAKRPASSTAATAPSLRARRLWNAVAKRPSGARIPASALGQQDGKAAPPSKWLRRT